MVKQQEKYDKFLKDIENLQNIVLVENGENDSEAHQLSEYFDCKKFLEWGERIMDKWHKHSESCSNFLARYAELQPSQEVSKLNVALEKQEIEQFISWF
jgi:hypothetical protein